MLESTRHPRRPAKPPAIGRVNDRALMQRRPRLPVVCTSAQGGRERCSSALAGECDQANWTDRPSAEHSIVR